MNIMGTYSGIDMSTIDQLIQAESSRGTRYTQQKTAYQQEQTAWKDVNGRLDNLYTRLDALKKAESFNSKTVNVSSKDYLSVSADENSATGEYRVQVKQLASASRLTGNRIDVASIKDDLNITAESTLSLTVNDGVDDAGIPINERELNYVIPANASLEEVKDLINEHAEDNKIKANIVDNRLIFTHMETGYKGLTVNDTGENGVEDILQLNVAAADGKSSIFTIDGIEIERDSNKIEDVIEGVTFTLKNIHEGSEADTLTIAEDTEKAADTMKALIDQYNSTISFIDDQLSVGDPSAEDNETGALSGDSALTRLQTNLRSMFTRNIVSDSESINNLQDLGVEIDRYGVATFDRETFIEKLETNQQDVVDFFSGTKEIQRENAEGVMETETELTGFANEARSLVDEYISSTTGIIKTKSDTYDRMINDINDRIDSFNLRIETKRQQYIRQFTALDTAMMQAESQLSFMMGQLGGTTGA
ncbi:flagellar filament capping protein FliD [Marinilactibacillus piezotolerans]|uniref:flagellar filament capping protein FliD n=1 Tax=Marinilactibacillus piezotolerans TaxID=258723 RepID=UPI0009AFD5CD|nr:flagellar filament capping protein FliD [Marinilactibacillus piezotolerans]